tara:strand:+ start:591 stop:803 length:213 start_codon:yes stop_codon:yes gene_type:complete
MKHYNMSATDKHSVLLHFTGEYKELYDNIRKKASELQIPISTLMRLLLKANINTNIVLNKSEVAENHKSE